MTNIGQGAFYDCTSLNSIISEIQEPFEIHAFSSSTYEKATLYVPAESLELYQSTSGWNEFVNIVELGLSLTLIITDEYDADITEKVGVVWYDADGMQIGTGYKLNGIEDSTEVYYSILFDEKLGRVYCEVKKQKIVVGKENETMTCKLQRIEEVALHGTVQAYGMAIPRAEVSLIQWLNGKYEYTAETKTDANGEFTLTAYNDSTELYIAADGYTDEMITRKMLGINGELGTIEMQQVRGKVVALQLSYQEAVREGEEPLVQNWYSDTRNIDYSVRNLTKETDINDFAMQQGDIVLPTGADQGDMIRVTLRSMNDKFAEVSGEGMIGENGMASISLQLKAYGGIEVYCNQKADEQISFMLYDSEGKLIKSNATSSLQTTLTGLKAGNYALVVMGYNNNVGTIGNLSDFEVFGLSEGSDYVKTNVTISDGIIGSVTVNDVPELDMSKFEYTAANTSYLPNKTEMTVNGSFVTLTARVDFKTQYANEVSDVKLLIDIPEGCEFIPNSVVSGSKPLVHSLNGSLLTITLNSEDIDSRIRFCMMPKQPGIFISTAYADFNCYGEKRQSIGLAVFEATAGSIIVPSVTGSKTITVNGIAAPHATVDIYDNDHLVGTTTALGDGKWRTDVDLYQPYNLSIHKINAKYQTDNGIKATTESRECNYDISQVKARSVTMQVYNPEFGRNFECFFDFATGTVTPSYYIFFPYKYENSWTEWWREQQMESKPFTFISDLTVNDTVLVGGVTFYVHTTSKEVRKLRGFFDNNLSRWVAVGEFDSYSLPVNVSVEIQTNVDTMVPLAETQKATDLLENIQTFINTSLIERSELDEKEAMVTQILDDDNSDPDTIKQLISQYAEFDFNSEDYDIIAKENFDNRMAQMIAQSDSLMEVIDEFLEDGLDDYSQYHIERNVLDDGRIVVKEVASCEGLSAEELMRNGYEKIPSTEGVLLCYMGDDFYEYVDFQNNIRFRYTVERGSLARNLRKAPSNWEYLWNGLQSSLQNALTDRDNLNWIINQHNEQRAQHFARIEFEERECRSLLNMVETDLKKEFTFNQFRNRHRLLRQLNHVEKRKARLNRLPQRISVAYSALNYLNQIIDIYQRLIVNYHRIRNFRIGECVQKNNSKAREVLEKIHAEVSNEYWNYARWRICMYATQIITDAWFKRLPIVGYALGVLEDAAANIRDDQFDRFVVTKINQLYQNSESAEKTCGKKKEVPNENPNDEQPVNDKTTPRPDQEETIPKEEAPSPQIQNIIPMIDPSGYVYEAVPTNRLEGVTATIYFDEEHPTQWDAADFSQVNPQITDDTGLYQWDVPQGMWQVRFEKPGYETTQTDWLPVPPPQLEINIPMSHAVAPTVVKARGMESGITLDFSKYMKPATIEKSGRVSVTVNGKSANGDVEMLNLEEDPYNQKEYASKVKFVPNKAFSTTDEVIITVKKEVESYASKQMEADFVQRVKIEPELTAIMCDSLLVVDYRDAKTLEVQVLPASASKGKTLQVVSTSPMIASTGQQEVILDQDGKAVITVSGSLPGSGAIKLSIPEADMTRYVDVSVTVKETVVKMPKASKRSGSVVEPGYQLTLTCSTPGATIYYALDGTCPCDEQKRIKYTSPITLPLGHITLKAVAVRDGMDDSDIVTYEYDVQKDGESGVQTIKEGFGIDVSYQDGGIVVSGAKGGDCHIYDLQGRELASRSKLSNHTRINVPKNDVYIVSVSYGNDQKVVCKVMNQ